MQRVKKKMSRGKAILILLAVIAVIALIVVGISAIFGKKNATGISVHQLPCPYDQNIRSFGNNVLYYDGMSLHCMNGNGSVRWSFSLGNNAGFDCDSEHIAAWSGSTIYVIDRNGNSTYNDSLGEEIQFARIGKQYVGAVVGDVTSSRLVVKDHTGAHMDEEVDAYANLIILDLGFYGLNGEYMWTLALDVFSTAANSVLHTFEVGKMNIGQVSLGENITYEVLYDNGVLRIVSTRKMLAFDYRGNEDTSQAALVYGWQLLDYDQPEKGNAMLLFAPTAQSANSYDIRELRLLMGGGTDRRYSLPATCVGATVWNKNVYAVSGTQLFRAALGDSRFTTYDLPLEKEVTEVLGTLDDGRIIVACDNEVFTVTLPRPIAVN
ncbi:MAG: hypothetical protein J6K72_09655 [Clostridia bacterium]|nr:hypothetical protein [Clostridia bacterium]